MKYNSINVIFEYSNKIQFTSIFFLFEKHNNKS